MATRMAENPMLSLSLRALQVVFAIIIMGTDGYAINVYRGHTSFVETPWGGYEGYFGVPNAWGFLIFCAAWTVLVVIFHYVTEKALADRLWTQYIHIAIEAIALLSWFAGWIAVAVNIETGACADGYVSCGALKAATVLGAFEWLMFMATTFFTISSFLHSKRQVAMMKT